MLVAPLPGCAHPARGMISGMIVHPRVGPILVDCETLNTPDLRQQLLVLTPADGDARERLELLRVLGLEEFPAVGAPAAGLGG